MRTNLDRAANGERLAGLALRADGRIEESEFQEGLVDALANLRHFARRHNLNWGAALDSAEMHHHAEARYSWDEVPG